MEETPDPAETSPGTTDDRAPLGVRVIAGFLLLSGVCTLLDMLLDVSTGRGLTLSFALASLPLGWGMLRRREWARVWTVVIASLSLCGSLLGLGLFAVIAASGKGEFSSNLDGLREWMKWSILIVGLFVTLAALAWAMHFLTSPQIIQWFHHRAAMPFIEWNPKRWKFGIGTLLFLTFLIAFATAGVMVHPAIQSLRAERWAEKQDLSDPIYFPHGADAPPSAGALAGRTSGRPDGSGCCMQFAVSEAVVPFRQPQLVYVVFDRWDNDQERLKTGVSVGMDNGKWTLSFDGVDSQEFTFPGLTQIFERHREKIRTSDMRITLLEFWSFHENPNAVWTLEGLETHVEDLRKRVAERDAAKSASP